MVLCGLLLLFHPVQQTFYSLLAILLALGSWVTSNMGGFFIGMLLGVVGGALAFAWQRGQRGPAKRRRRPRPQREPSAGLALIRGDQPADTRPVQGGPPADTWPGGARHSSRPGETLRGATAILAIPLTPLVLSALASPAPHDRAASQSRPAISASPSTAPTTIASPAPRLSPTPGPTPSATPGPTPSLTPTPSPSAVPSPRPTRTHPRHVPAAGAPTARASTTPATLTAGSAVLAGLSFDGVAQVPTAAGPVPMLKFSMASLALSAGTKLLISQGGHVLLTAEAPSLELSGDVVLYTTEISGTLAGHQVTFTPKRPPSQLGHDVTLGSFVVHQPYASTGVLQASGYQVT
jgi:hypothetical protein